MQFLGVCVAGLVALSAAAPVPAEENTAAVQRRDPYFYGRTVTPPWNEDEGNFDKRDASEAKAKESLDKRDPYWLYHTWVVPKNEDEDNFDKRDASEAEAKERLDKRDPYFMGRTWTPPYNEDEGNFVKRDSDSLAEGQ